MFRPSVPEPERRDLSDSPACEVEWSEMIEAIAALYFEHPSRLDIRRLWTQHGLSYFRVNWWHAATDAAPRVRRSAFVAVESRPYGCRVLDRTHRRAA